MKKYLLTSALVSVLAAMAFNNTAGWKVDDAGAIVLKDGNPVWINTAGVEQTVGGDTITKLNGEAKSHRERAEAAETKLKTFEGIDPEAARKSIELVGKLDAKKLIDVGEVDKVKAEIQQQFTTQVGEKDKTIGTLQSQINDMLVDGVFGNSQFVRDRVAVPADMFSATFRKNFKVEEGKVIAFGADGNRLFSKTRSGEYATPEEALEIMVEAHGQKDTILKAVDHSGSGNTGNGGSRGAGNVLKRADFEKLPPAKQAEISKKAATGEMKIVD